ncbi:MAG: threonine dehydratase, partial [Candidatus Eremiobacteraeota bacterium]|nr:threonine dehydratase [Candidatus Eremiobacteraeota bacterium]
MASVPFALTLAEVDWAAALVRDVVPATPAFRWPLLCDRLGVDVTLKHENHTPLGAFKLRGGLTYVAALRERLPHVTRLVSATRGNHGQSIAFAAARAGLRATLVVPEGNSPEKNAAMRAHGAELVVHGRDFDDAKAHAQALVASDEHAHFVPSYHRDLVVGVATYARELFAAAFDVVYVPIGLGSGISGVIAVRDLLGVHTEVVGVVAERFPAYARSVERGASVETEPAESVADGMAVRATDPA